MDKIKRMALKDWVWRLALVIMVICLIEGFIYFNKTQDDVNIWMLILLNIQNAVKAYKIDPDIKLKDAFTFLNRDDLKQFERVMTGIYCGAVVVAPFCTIAALTMLIRAPFKYIKGKFTDHSKGKLLILGDGNIRERFLKSIRYSGYKTAVVVYGPLDDSSKIRYLEAGVKTYVLYKDRKLPELFKTISLEKYDKIFICNDESVKNITVIKEVDDYLCGGGKEKKKSKKQSIYVTAEETGIKDVIHNCFGEKPKFNADLNIVDLKQMAVDTMFEKYHIYECNELKMAGKTADVLETKDFNVHMAIVGFGEYGQKTLIEALNLSVLSSEAKVIFDIYDKNIKTILPGFMKIFSPRIMEEMEKNGTENGSYKQICFNRNSKAFCSDGETWLRFWDSDVDTLDFTDRFNNNNLEEPYTYIVVAMDTEKRMASSVIEIRRLLEGMKDSTVLPTVVVRSKDTGDVFATMNAENKERIKVFPYREDEKIYSIEAIVGYDVVKKAKKFNRRYVRLSEVIYRYMKSLEANEADENKKIYHKMLTDERCSYIFGKVKIASLKKCFKVLNTCPLIGL